MIFIYISPCDTQGTPRERGERASREARELLFSALEREMSLPPREIKKTEQGKPFFADSQYPPFSISHADGAVAVAIGAACEEIGVDIEKISPRLSDTKLTDRFFGGIKLGENEIDDIKIVTDAKILPAYDGAPARFTLGEATVKCDGGGFAVAGRVSELAKKMERASFVAELCGERYSLSVAVRRKGENK